MIGQKIACLAIGYLFGLFQTGYLYGKWHHMDIRKYGSGNSGTTNALRVMGKKAGAITLVVDILKGTCAVVLGYLLAGNTGAMWCVVAVFCGHVWPVFFGFRGGKGVATAFGALLGLNPLMALATLAIVVIGVLITRRMSVGSILGAICFPVLSYFMEPDFVHLGIIVAVIVLVKHRSNIGRLIRGEEPIMSIFEKKDDSREQEGK